MSRISGQGSHDENAVWEVGAGRGFHVCTETPGMRGTWGKGQSPQKVSRNMVLAQHCGLAGWSVPLDTSLKRQNLRLTLCLFTSYSMLVLVTKNQEEEREKVERTETER
jgi:hypothetical protein